MKRLIPLVMAAALTSASAGCYGSYSAFRSVHRWNGHATGSEVANSAIHLGLWVVQFYPVCFVADFLIFNNVEFLTGNPVFK